MPNALVTAEEAAKLLQDVSQDWQAFWFNNGVVAKNVRELSDALASMTEEQFEHHVNPEKNDLANWLEAVVGDESLGKKLRLLRTLAGTHAMLSRRVVELEACCAAAAPAAEEAPAISPAAETETVTLAHIKTAKRSTAKKPAKKPVAAKKEKAAAKAGAAAKKGSVWSKLLKR